MPVLSKLDKRQHTDRKIAFKIKICREIDAGNKITAVAKNHGVAQGTVSGWYKNRFKLYKQEERCTAGEKERMRNSLFPDVEEALYEWLRNLTRMERPPPISLEILKKKATQ